MRSVIEIVGCNYRRDFDRISNGERRIRDGNCKQRDEEIYFFFSIHRQVVMKDVKFSDFVWLREVGRGLSFYLEMRLIVKGDEYSRRKI